MNDDFQKQQMEKEAGKKHIDKLDEKIQQADIENEKVGVQTALKKCINQSFCHVCLSFVYSYSDTITLQWASIAHIQYFP